LPSINSKTVSFVGAWTSFGFHEDGFTSGIRAAEKLGAKLPFNIVDSRHTRDPGIYAKSYMWNKVTRLLLVAIQGVLMVFLEDGRGGTERRLLQISELDVQRSRSDPTSNGVPDMNLRSLPFRLYRSFSFVVGNSHGSNLNEPAFIDALKQLWECMKPKSFLEYLLFPLTFALVLSGLPFLFLLVKLLSFANLIIRDGWSRKKESVAKYQ
jgi:hypothetical protein